MKEEKKEKVIEISVRLILVGLIIISIILIILLIPYFQIIGGACSRCQ